MLGDDARFVIPYTRRIRRNYIGVHQTAEQVLAEMVHAGRIVGYSKEITHVQKKENHEKAQYRFSGRIYPRMYL